MTATEFVDAIHEVVLEAATSDAISILEEPPGRRPDARLVELSRWYLGLDEQARNSLRAALDLVARASVFGFLVVLDGSRVIESPETRRGFLELRYVAGDEEEVLSGPRGSVLHELLR